MPNSERLKAASHRPLEDSSRINACWACTSRKVKGMLAASRVSRIRERPSRSTCVSYFRKWSTGQFFFKCDFFDIKSVRAGYILTCLPKTMATSPLPVKSPFLIFTSVSSDLPLPRVAECTLRNLKLSIHFYSTIMVQAPSLTRLQSSRMWLVPGDQTRTAFLSFQFCLVTQRKGKQNLRARPGARRGTSR